VPFSIRKIPNHEVIEVSKLRPYQPYDRLILRDAPAGRTTWTVLECEQQGDAWQARNALPRKLSKAPPDIAKTLRKASWGTPLA
jgi:hypothetical protein